jgi:hypothetical protein
MHTKFHIDRLRRTKFDNIDTQTAWLAHTPFFFFQNKESRLDKHTESHYLSISIQQFMSLSIILSTLFSDTLNVLSSFRMGDKSSR